MSGMQQRMLSHMKKELENKKGLKKNGMKKQLNKGKKEKKLMKEVKKENNN